MAMNTYSVVKRINVFKYQPVRLMEILNLESIRPFPFDQGVEGFDAGIILWIAFFQVAVGLLSCFLNVCLRNVLVAAVRMDD